jgi:hypothetical protein
MNGKCTFEHGDFEIPREHLGDVQVWNFEAGIWNFQDARVNNIDSSVKCLHSFHFLSSAWWGTPVILALLR